MNKILACIDTRGNTDAVIDWAAWAAVRLACPLEFLHVLERHPEVAAVTDFSGAIGVDAQASLLKALSDRDERESIALRSAGRRRRAPPGWMRGCGTATSSPPRSNCRPRPTCSSWASITTRRRRPASVPSTTWNA